MIRVRYFAAAADAAGKSSENVDAGTLGDLIDTLTARHDAGFAEVLARCSLLVDGTYRDERGYCLDAAMGVDVLPPFAGG
ncbi:MAG: MoaD/ThiS family protein [Arachnia sp.]